MIHTTLVQNVNMPHPRLMSSSDSVRLPKLLPGFHDEPISCRIYAVNLADNPKYFALSYMWGPIQPKYEIILNAQPFRVRENLWQLPRGLRAEDSSFILWCDQLCIDQKDEKEKGHQVRNMGKIYDTAEETWVWLGNLDPNTEKTMRFVSRVAKVYDQATFDKTVLNNMNPGYWWSTNRYKLGGKPGVFA